MMKWEEENLTLTVCNLLCYILNKISYANICLGGKILGNKYTHTPPRPLTLVLLGGERRHGWWEPLPSLFLLPYVLSLWVSFCSAVHDDSYKNMTHVASHPHDDSVIVDLSSAFYLCNPGPPLWSHGLQTQQVSSRAQRAQVFPLFPLWSTLFRPLTPLQDSFIPECLRQAHPSSSHPSNPTSALPKEKGKQLCLPLDLTHRFLSRLDQQRQIYRSPASNIKK